MSIDLYRERTDKPYYKIQIGPLACLPQTLVDAEFDLLTYGSSITEPQDFRAEPTAAGKSLELRDLPEDHLP